MKNQKGFTPVLIVLLIVVIVGIGGLFIYEKYFDKSYLQPETAPEFSIPTNPSTPVVSPDETANWKTYTNNDYNFSLKYPNKPYGWVLSNGHDDYGIRKELVRFGKYVIVYKLENSKKLSAVDFINQLPDYEGGGFVHALSQQPIYFSNLDAVETNGFGGGGVTGNSAYINDDKGDIIMLFTTDIKQDMIDQILSTFKFTQ